MNDIQIDDGPQHEENRNIRKNGYLKENWISRYVNFVVPPIKGRPFTLVANEERHFDSFLMIDKTGSYKLSTPLFLLLVSSIQIICFAIDKIGNGETIFSLLMFDPHNRKECWRFLTYMLVHDGYLHLIINLICQLFLGVPLEMVHKWWRILIVYICGVTAGSLTYSIWDSRYLIGASGGVSALITAHIPNFILNRKKMQRPVVQMIGLAIIIIADVVYQCYCYFNYEANIGYLAHAGGSLAGFLVGIFILRDLEPSKKEKYFRLIGFSFYFLLMVAAVLLHIFWTQHFSFVSQQ